MPDIAKPVIPETITVHLGTPDSDAQNVTLSFPDYIKNVASSEIYPTWPGSRDTRQHLRPGDIRTQPRIYRVVPQPRL